MQIDHVGYHHLFNLGNYENEKIEAEAFVLADEDPAVVLAQLKEWVAAQGAENKKRAQAEERAYQQLHTAQRELEQINREIAGAKKRWEGVTAFFGRANLELPQRWVEDDIPF